MRLPAVGEFIIGNLSLVSLQLQSSLLAPCHWEHFTEEMSVRQSACDLLYTHITLHQELLLCSFSFKVVEEQWLDPLHYKY